jgi:hypothetical protein
MFHTAANFATNADIRVTNVMFFLTPDENVGSAFLLPIPISFELVEDPDADPGDWVTTNFQYCFQGLFTNALELKSAYDNGQLKICTMKNSGFGWTLVEPVEPILSDSYVKEPASFHPSGKRYNIQSAGAGTTRRVLKENESTEKTGLDISDRHISNFFKHYQKRLLKGKTPKDNKKRSLQFDGGDGTGHKVSWMGWSFHVSSDQMSGLVLRNLSFKGERLAYELSFQEYFASYSSAGSSAETFYFDSNWEIGNLSPLEPGVDCPEDATYLPIVQQYGTWANPFDNLICIFEQPYGEPMWRHGWGDEYIGGIPRVALQIRIISTMGNYDYIPTVTLMPDGVVQAKLEMAGYLQTGYSLEVGEPNPEKPQFGAQVRDNSFGLFHDHVVSVKADLDVGGLQNTLNTGIVKYGTYEEATGTTADWLSFNGVKYMEWTPIVSEQSIKAKDYNVITVESSQKNTWGEKRSYDIVFHNTIAGQLFPVGHPLYYATGWQDGNVAVTRQKDSEHKCSYPSNFLVGHSISSFDLRNFMQGADDIEDEDIVLWMMFGVQHYPKAEDVPLVSNFGSGFMLKPRNMYDRAAFENLADNRDSNPAACVAGSVF